MKKLVSIILTLAAVFVFSITAFAAGSPYFELPEAKLFSVSLKDGVSPEEIYNYGLEKGFNGVLLDLRESASMDFYSDCISAANRLEYFEFYVLVNESHMTKTLKPGKYLVFSEGISEETIAEYSEASGSECLSFIVPFGDEKALETAKYFYGKGYFKNLFVENLLSCHSEYGYEEYLLEIAKEFPEARIITVNDLGKVLSPSAKGDFYSDPFEINNQVLFNKLNGFGFCVSDYSELVKNIGGKADFLTAYFDSKILEEHANFSYPKKLSITRPAGSKISVATDKYTVFGTSDPEKPLYMNGEEIERISSGGLFAVTVDSSKNGKKYTFSQENDSVSITVKKGSSSSGSGTTTKLTSCFPSGSETLDSENAEIKLSCVGPSGGYVTAKIGEKTFVLEQVAYADKGVPAKFSKTVDLSGEYSENEVTEIGKVTYNLSYNGKNTSYESASAIYYIGENAEFAVRANVDLAGVEKGDFDAGNYITTLRSGCVDYVSEISENGWYKVSSGGYMKPSHCEIITGETDITASVSSVSREIGDNYEKLILSCSNFPAFKGSISGKTFSLTLYNTEWSDFSSTDMESKLMYRINPVDNGDGSVTVNFYSKVPLWGWDIFTDSENGTFSVVLKGTPKLSENAAKPLSGITVAVCSGHGGGDPGALSVVGEGGVYESEINLVNTLTIGEALENLGANVVLIVADEKTLDSYERTDPARYAYADVYICCHANSIAENAAANLWCGTYVYYHYDHSADFAKRICDYLSASTKRDNEGAEAGYYSVTRLTMCPAVMLEVGFVSNPKELESLIDPIDIQKTAFAVTKAVLEICDN